MYKIEVVDIMTRDPVTISPHANLLECAKKMVKNRVGSLILVENKLLKGIISEKDILWALVKKSKKDLSDIKAIDISPKKIATINPNSPIEEVIKKVKRFKFSRFPVVRNRELVGMVTVNDILNFYPELHSEFKELETIREEKNKLQRLKQAEIKARSEGICEECGNHDFLYKVNGILICESCMHSM